MVKPCRRIPIDKCTAYYNGRVSNSVIYRARTYNRIRGPVLWGAITLERNLSTEEEHKSLIKCDKLRFCKENKIDHNFHYF